MRAKDFLEESKVVSFQPRDDRTDQEKYNDAMSDQMAKNYVHDEEEPFPPLRDDIGKTPCPHCGEVWCNITDCHKAPDSENDVDEGDVISTKFQQALAQKKGMHHNPDAEPPVSRKTGEAYVRFEIEPMPSGNSAAMIGVLADGTKEEIGFTNIKLADALTRAYNAGGYTDLDIAKIPLGRNKE